MNQSSGERRKRSRAKPALAQGLKVAFDPGSGGAVEVAITVVDSSDEGIGVELAIPLIAGSIVSMSGTLSIDGCRTDLTGRARVQWCRMVREGVYAAGLRFEDAANRFRTSETFLGGAPEVDYYEVLEVNVKATPDTIHRVYRILAQRYHPDNSDTGNEELFKQLLEAYRILSNPEQRAAYDVHGLGKRQTQWKIFEHAAVSHGLEGERRKRYGILSLLYAKRVNEPELPGVTLHELEDLLGCPREHLAFSLWYLKENHYITRTDNGRHSITAKGVEYAESSAPAGILDRLLSPARP